MSLFQYQGKAEPPLIGWQGSETVTMEKWWKESFNPVYRRKPARTGIEQFYIYEPLSVLPRMDSWFVEHFNPTLRRVPARTGIESFSVLADPERDRLTDWFHSQPEQYPHRKRYDSPEGMYSHVIEPIQFGLEVDWIHQRPDANRQATKATTRVIVDYSVDPLGQHLVLLFWYPQLAEVFRARRTNLGYYHKQEFVSPPSLDAWYLQTNEIPVRRKLLTPQDYVYKIGFEVEVGWFRDIEQPVRLKKNTQPIEKAEPSPAAYVTVDTITVDMWGVQAPFFPRRKSSPAYNQDSPEPIFGFTIVSTVAVLGDLGLEATYTGVVGIYTP